MMRTRQIDPNDETGRYARLRCVRCGDLWTPELLQGMKAADIKANCACGGAYKLDAAAEH